MVKAQEWLDKKYPKKERGYITELLLEENLEGNLDLSDFRNLISVSSKHNSPKNGITSINLDKNSFLCYVDLWNNELTTINTSNNSYLIKLLLGKNKLASIDVSKNPNLIQLNCVHNQITKLNLDKNKKLKKLHCFGNDNLQGLDLSNNPDIKEDSYLFLKKGQKGRNMKNIHSYALATNLPKEKIVFFRKNNSNRERERWKTTEPIILLEE